jgi:Taurine catabolism dioxygenase TauD, TfdA family
MSTSSQTALLDVDLRPGRPPVREPWQAGDLLLVDNIGTAHSREPFKGPREVVVGMADPRRLTDWSPNGEVGGR